MLERGEFNPQELENLRESRVYGAFVAGLITYYFVTKAPEAFVDFVEDVSNQGSLDWKRALALGVSTLFTVASWQTLRAEHKLINELKQKQQEEIQRQQEESFYTRF